MDFPLPPVGEGVYEVELVRYLVAPGEVVRRGQPLLEVLSDKATMEVPAPFAGTVTATRAEPGARINVGQVVLEYTPDGANPAPRAEGLVPSALAPATKAEGTPPSARKVQANGPAVAAAPSVRLLARRLGIDLAAVRGTGPGGRVLHDDLAPFLTRPADAPPAKPAGPDYGRLGTRSKLAGVRRKIAENMVAAKQHIPHFAYVDECDLTDLVRLRGQLKDTFAAKGVKLTYLPFIVKAVARALKDVPVLNSTFDDENQETITHDRIHVGVAVAAHVGLLVPVVRDADQRDIAAIAAEIDRLGTDARGGRAKPDDLRGGTFTVTSVGGIGGLISTPIINRPQVGILGVGKVVKRPVYDAAGNLRPADMGYLSFSFDHRIIDGAVGAAFGNAVVRHLSNPATLLLG